MSEFLSARNGWWHFVRRVPASLADRDPRRLVRQSTKIKVADDPRGVRAQRIADHMNQSLENFWRDVGRRESEAQARYDAARRIARNLGLDYAPMHEIAGSPLEILQRLRVLEARNKLDEPAQVDAGLGREGAPSLMLSGLFAEYEAVMKAANSDMSSDQLKRWRMGKERAVANLIRVVGDKPLSKITRSDALDFQEWWHNRVVSDAMDIGTANKEIGHINKMVRVVNQRRRLGLSDTFAEMRIEGARLKSRSAFTTTFVQDELFADAALVNLNEEARRAVYLIAETGMRLSEAVNLTTETIVLQGPVPHVQIRPNGRRMKTEQSERDIPLVGVALLAMREQPQGFPRYRSKADVLSAAVNKFLGENRLRPSTMHTLYSLRHTFEDRLTAVEAPEKLIAALMGHKYSRPKYGSGPSLEQKREWLQRIALRPPSTV